ncbi:MAG: hypothetical protein WCC14_00335 [Acidobacteriaceae bacterium]
MSSISESTADVEAGARPQPAIRESFSGYKPPFNVVRAVQRMLDFVPPRYLNGLSAVVLTNSDALPQRRLRRKTKSRGRKVATSRALGIYHPARYRQPAWIEIFVDRIFRDEKWFWHRVRFMRESTLGDVLFHEIGHHIHYTVRPEHREKEDVADVWQVRLAHSYFQKSFPLICGSVHVFERLAGPWFHRLYARKMKEALRKGQVSRAEYEESLRTTGSASVR